MDKLSTFYAVKTNLQVSGELTTSRGPGTCYMFCVSLVEQLFGDLVAKEIVDTMVSKSELGFLWIMTERYVFSKHEIRFRRAKCVS